MSFDEAHAHLKAVRGDEGHTASVEEAISNSTQAHVLRLSPLGVSHEQNIDQAAAHVHKSSSWFSSLVGGPKANTEIPRPPRLHLNRRAAAVPAPARTHATLSTVAENPKQNLREWIQFQSHSTAGGHYHHSRLTATTTTQRERKIATPNASGAARFMSCSSDRSPSWSESETEECAWAPGSPTGRQGCDLVAAKRTRQSTVLLGNCEYQSFDAGVQEFQAREESVRGASSDFVPDSPECSPSWSEDETEDCAWAPGSPTGQQGSDLVSAKKRRQQSPPLSARGLGIKPPLSARGIGPLGLPHPPLSARLMPFSELQEYAGLSTQPVPEYQSQPVPEYQSQSVPEYQPVQPVSPEHTSMFGQSLEENPSIMSAVTEAVKWLDTHTEQKGLWGVEKTAEELATIQSYAESNGSFPLSNIGSCHSVAASLKKLFAEIPGGLVDAITTAHLLERSAGPLQMVKALTARLSKPKLELLCQLLEHWRQLIEEPANQTTACRLASDVAKSILFKPSPLVMDSMLTTPMQVLLEAQGRDLQGLHDALAGLCIV